MKIDTNHIITMTEANQNFSKEVIITGIALNISSGKYKYEDVLKIIESLKDI